MAWSTIRRASADEIDALQAAVARIAARYEIPEHAVEWDMRDGYTLAQRYWQTGPYSNRLKRAQRAYRRAVARILGGSAEGIAWGYVGYHLD